MRYDQEKRLNIRNRNVIPNDSDRSPPGTVVVVVMVGSILYTSDAGG
jgi:hypothetical protein